MADEIKNNTPEDQEDDGIIELEDENGKTDRFVLMAPVEYEDEVYLALMPEEQANSEEDDGEIVLLHVETDENGEEIYTSVDDDDLADKVFAKFLEMMDEENGED